jgi:acyl carrier protein
LFQPGIDMKLTDINEQIVTAINLQLPRSERGNEQWKDKTLADLQVDSLAMAEIVFNIEDAFGIEIDFGTLDPGLTKMKAIDACQTIAVGIQPLILAQQARAAALLQSMQTTLG